jgi:hypothetical protein
MNARICFVLLLSIIFIWNRFVPIKTQSTISLATATLSEARFRLAATSSGDLIFFAGGKKGSSGPGSIVSDRVDIYNAISETWTIAALSIPRSDLAATSSWGFVFFGGGWDGVYDSNVYDRVDIYNTANGSWSTATLSQARGALAATAVGDLVFFAGGWNFKVQSPPLNVVDMYNLTSNTWTVTTLSQARAFLRATTAGNRYALFAGGQNNASSFKVVDIFDLSTQGWSTATLSQARADMAAASLGNWAFFAGGDNGTLLGAEPSNIVSIIDIFNSETRQWSTATLSQPRTWPAAASIGDIVAFGGGSSDANSSSDRIDIYDRGNNTWYTMTLSHVRHYLAAASAGNKIVFAGGAISGGFNASTFSNQVDVLTVSTPPSAPSTPSTPPPPRSSNGGRLLFNIGN